MSDPGTRPSVVWTGRGSPDAPRGLDGWNTPPAVLGDALDGARELVITDPLSFPWRHLPIEKRSLPLTVTLPAELGAEALPHALGKPLLRHLTRFDRLVEDRPDVRDRLTEEFGLPPEVWEPGAGDAAERHAAKARLYEEVAVVRRPVRRLDGATEDRLLVGFVGRACELAGLVSSGAGTRGAEYELAPSHDVESPPSPDILVAALDDGAQDVGQRATLLTRARDLLHPGGRLVLLGYVVDTADGAANPTISQLVEELHDVFGGMLHVDELQSVQWDGEPGVRGALLRATSLRVGVI